MGLFGKNTAKKIDTAAKALHDTGQKIAGETGGRVGDAVASTVLGPIRSRCNTSCTRSGCNHS